MAIQLTVGGIDEATYLLDQLTLPVLDDVDAVGWIADCLTQAATERKGVVAIGEKGAGKTVALRRAIDRFMEAERIKESADAKYRRRRVLLVRSLRARNRRDTLVAIWHESLGTAPNVKVRGRAKTDDEITNELVEELLHQRVCVLAVDEAETLSDHALQAIRDLMSVAEDRCSERFSGDSYRAAGIGVLLVADWKLEPRLTASDESGQRWVRIQPVSTVPAADIADIYRRMLRAIDAHAEDIRDAAWQRFIRRHVTRGQSFPIRFVENHVRAYIRRIAAFEPVANLEDLVWDEEIFRMTLEETVRPRYLRVENEAA